MKSLLLSVLLNLIKYLTDFNVVFSNRWNDSRGKYVAGSGRLLVQFHNTKKYFKIELFTTRNSKSLNQKDKAAKI